MTHEYKETDIPGVCDRCGLLEAECRKPTPPPLQRYATFGAQAVVCHLAQGSGSLCGTAWHSAERAMAGHEAPPPGTVACDLCEDVAAGKGRRAPPDTPAILSRRQALLKDLQARYGQAPAATPSEPRLRPPHRDGFPAACGHKVPRLSSVPRHEKSCKDCRALEQERGIIVDALPSPPPPPPAPPPPHAPPPPPAPQPPTSTLQAEREDEPMPTTIKAPCGQECKNKAGLAIHKGKCVECRASLPAKTKELIAKKAPKLLDCPECEEKTPLLVSRGKGKSRLCPRCSRAAEDTVAPELAATAPRRRARKLAPPPTEPTERMITLVEAVPAPVDDADEELRIMSAIAAGFRRLSPASKNWVRGYVGGT